VAHLPHDEVQEALAVPDGEQRLGAVHAHGGAEPAVELDDRGLCEGVAGCFVVDRDAGQRVWSKERLDGVFEDKARSASLELSVVVGEDVDSSGIYASRTHLFLGLNESCCAHAVNPNRSWCDMNHAQ